MDGSLVLHAISCAIDLEACGLGLMPTSLIVAVCLNRTRNFNTASPDANLFACIVSHRLLGNRIIYCETIFPDQTNFEILSAFQSQFLF